MASEATDAPAPSAAKRLKTSRREMRPSSNSRMIGATLDSLTIMDSLSFMLVWPRQRPRSVYYDVPGICGSPVSPELLPPPHARRHRPAGRLTGHIHRYGEWKAWYRASAAREAAPGR